MTIKATPIAGSAKIYISPGNAELIAGQLTVTTKNQFRKLTVTSD